MKGNEGDQNYDVPADLDLQKFRAVTLWCRRFSVNFATAPLTGPRCNYTPSPPFAHRAASWR
jgi:hypothetical protein